MFKIVSRAEPKKKVSKVTATPAKENKLAEKDVNYAKFTGLPVNNQPIRVE